MRPDNGLYPWLQIKRLAVPGTGHTPSRDRPELWRAEDCIVPWFTLADVWQIRDGGVSVVTETAERLSRAGIAASAAVLHPAGTVLLSRTASVGYSAVMGTDMAVSQDYMTWTPGPALDSRFLLYVLRGQRQEFARLMSGSTHKTIYMPDLLALRTPAPPLERQLEIARFLDRECARIDELREELAGLRGELSFDRIDRVSRALAGLPEVRLRYRLAGIDQGWSPQCEECPADENEWGVLKVGCVNYGEFRPAENKRLPPHLEPRPAVQVRIGDVLMSRANTRELAGSVALVTDTGRARLMMSDKLYRLTPTPALLPAFAAMVLNSRRVRDQIEVDTTGASGSMQNISQQLVRSLLIPDCPVEKQAALVAEAARSSASYRSVVAEINAISDRLMEYRDALITEAVTGELEVTRLTEPQMDESLDAVRRGERPEALAS